MSTITAPSCISSRCRLTVHVLAAPVKSLYALFLKILGHLLNFFGAKLEGAHCRFRAVQIENRCESLYQGLWAYGRRFLAFSDNHGRAFSADLQKYQEKGYCRGGCYSLIDQFFRNPETPLIQLVQPFEEGVPDEVVRLHEARMLPASLLEDRVSTVQTTGDWSAIPTLDAFPLGVYTFLLGFSRNLNTPQLAHRVAFFKLREETYLVDLSKGLVVWRGEDWHPLLERIAASIRTSTDARSFFTAEWYRHQPR
jgi:hypothetical protein